MKAKPFSPDSEKKFCCYCGKWLVTPLYHNIEHLVPLSKGGNNSEYNKRLCCIKCNSWRGNKSLEVWHAEISELIEENKTKRPYNLNDLKIILQNIEYLKHYIDTSGNKLKRKSWQTIQNIGQTISMDFTSAKIYYYTPDSWR